MRFGRCRGPGGTEDPDQPCQFCRSVLSSFPLHSLLKAVPCNRTFCLSHIDRIRTVFLRDGAEDTLRSNDGAEMLLSCLMNELYPMVTWVFSSKRRKVETAFVKKMRDQGASCYSTGMTLYGTTSLSKSLKGFLELVKSTPLMQNVMKGIPRGKLLEKFRSQHGFMRGNIRGKIVFSRQIFDALLGAGWNLNGSDYIILVDPEKEPALAQHL